jgi:integrase
MIKATENNVSGVRNRALLLVAYDTLCRRSELVSLRIEDIKVKEINGDMNTTILLRRSKTDQDSKGRWLHLSKRSQEALSSWIMLLNQDEGPLF